MDCCCVCVPPPDTAPVAEPINFWAGEVNLDVLGNQYAEWMNGDPESDQPPNDPSGGRRNNNNRNNNNNNKNPKKEKKQNQNNNLNRDLFQRLKAKEQSKKSKAEDGDDNEDRDEEDKDVDYGGRTNSPWSTKGQDRRGTEDLLRAEMHLSPNEIIKRSQERYSSFTHRNPTQTRNSETQRPQRTLIPSSSTTASAPTTNQPINTPNKSPNSIPNRPHSHSQTEEAQTCSQIVSVNRQTKTQKYQLAIMDILIVLILVILLLLLLKKYFQISLPFSNSI